MDRFFARRGEATVALARLIPVVRSYISYPAGTAKMPPVHFGAYTVAGLLPFEVAFVYLGVVLRSHWGEIESLFGWFDYAVFGLVVVAGVYLYLLLTERVAPGWPVRRTGPERPPKVPRP
jgi:membrane protein DedA with SNARE-associated domain